MPRKGMEVNGHRLDRQQSDAVLDNADTELVIAAAGTGKTTTLVGKVKHLVGNGADPSHILMISLTNNTVHDLREALEREFGPGFGADVMTIHALGNRITRRRPCVGKDRSTLLSSIMYDLCECDRKFAVNLMAYIEDLRTTGMGDLSLNGMYIRPRGLRILADELFRHGIQCKYTAQTFADGKSSPAVLEADDGHGHKLKVLGDSMRASELSSKPAKASEYIKDQGFSDDLLNANDLAAAVVNAWGPRLSEPIGALISRCKCTRTTIRDLRRANGRNPTAIRPQIEQELNVLDAVWDHYSLTCIKGGMADYDDMVIQATEDVASMGPCGKAYTHVLVDEYQDVSRTLVDLLLALRRRMGFRLFCVGDDWQSIYSFTGGDIGQFYDFRKTWSEFGSVSVKRIETTYRYPQTIADLAGDFVMKNAKQQKKSVKGVPDPPFKPVMLLPANTDKDISKMIANRIEHLPDDESVFVIGRTRADLYALGSGTGQFRFSSGDLAGSCEVVFRRWDKDAEDWSDDRKIRFLTAHSAKGLEADNVFILADRDRGGFPNTVSDNLSDLFPRVDEDIPYPEERRVFYVALTRARKRAFIVTITDDDNYAQSSKSPFVTELLGQSPTLSRATLFCPECFGPLRIARGPSGLFYGCCDYPNCKGNRPFNGF